MVNRDKKHWDVFGQTGSMLKLRRHVMVDYLSDVDIQFGKSSRRT